MFMRYNLEFIMFSISLLFFVLVIYDNDNFIIKHNIDLVLLNFNLLRKEMLVFGFNKTAKSLTKHHNSI